jgi:hypothetical protein
MPRRTRGSGGAFFSRTKKQHRKTTFLFVFVAGIRRKCDYRYNVSIFTPQRTN